MNIFDFAMEMEENGFDYYTNLAQAASLPGLKTIFSGLAADEQKHLNFFRKLKEGKKPGTMAESQALDAAQNIFLQLSKETEQLKDITGALPAYKHAMKLEAESFRLYEKALETEKDPEIKNILQQIASEEHNHFNILENIYNFVNAPNQHLEWAEFSNLSEFRQYGRDLDI
jgi:rubrerythrin